VTTRKELTLRHGGLMRCCTASFAEWVQELPDNEVQPGEQIECHYERKATMVVDEFARYAEWLELPK
jgi:hypothetical protein